MGITASRGKQRKQIRAAEETNRRLAALAQPTQSGPDPTAWLQAINTNLISILEELRKLNAAESD